MGAAIHSTHVLLWRNADELLIHSQLAFAISSPPLLPLCPGPCPCTHLAPGWC